MITGNTAKEGGGIYNNNDDNSVSGTTIINNIAQSDGGGMFSSCMNDLALSGKVVISMFYLTSQTVSSFCAF